jgi:hypothetical protein
MKIGQLVMGPAGSGKSTYCLEIQKHITQINHSAKIVNLDPSVENIEYPNSVDIRKLINVKEVMEEFYLGPNGALIFCMEYLMDNLYWLEDEISSSFEKYLIFDLPGQIELYSHNSLMKELVIFLNNRCNLNIIGLFLLDCQFIVDIGKFFSGSIVALSCMISLDTPHYNILNKIDLVKNISKKIFDKFLYPNSKILTSELNMITNYKYKNMTIKISRLLEDFCMIHYLPLDISCPDNIDYLFKLINQSFEIE